jgi:hypothetical protein
MSPVRSAPNRSACWAGFMPTAFAYHMADHQDWFLDRAEKVEYVEFEQLIRQWERLIDQIGAELAADRAHRNRDFTLIATWRPNG